MKKMPEYLAGKTPSIEQLNTWIESFHTNGFLVIPNVLTPEKCEVLRNDYDKILKKTEDEIAKTRELIGYESDLMLDCWLSMDIETTVKLSQLLKPYKLKWIEDALLSESINQYEVLRKRIPEETLSTGEHWYGVYPFFHAASKGIIDIFRVLIIKNKLNND